MESLNPTLKLIWQVKKSIEKGASVRSGIKNYLHDENDPWKQVLILWLLKLEQGSATSELVQSQKSPYRRQLLFILEKGIKGESVLPILTQLEKETQEKVEMDLEEFTMKIPLHPVITALLIYIPGLPYFDVRAIYSAADAGVLDKLAVVKISCAR